jgi:cysteinyl-tRNA synthetase
MKKKHEYTNTLQVKFKEVTMIKNMTDIYADNKCSKKSNQHGFFRTMVFSFELRDPW